MILKWKLMIIAFFIIFSSLSMLMFSYSLVSKHFLWLPPLLLHLYTLHKYTVKLEMFAVINVCEFVISKVFALLKFAILGLPKVNFVFPKNNIPLLILLIGYIRWLVIHIVAYK